MGKGEDPHLADVAAADADDLGTGTHRRDVGGYLLRLLDAAADDAGVCAEADERPGLHAADCAGATSHEDDAVVWMNGQLGPKDTGEGDERKCACACVSLKMPSFQTGLRYSDSGTGMTALAC